MADDRSLTLRLPSDLWEALRDRAAAEDRSVSSLLRVAARRYLATPLPEGATDG